MWEAEITLAFADEMSNILASDGSVQCGTCTLAYELCGGCGEQADLAAEAVDSPWSAGAVCSLVYRHVVLLFGFFDVLRAAVEVEECAVLTRFRM